MRMSELAAAVNADMAKGLKSKTIRCMAIIGGIGAGLYEYHSPAPISGAFAQARARARATPCMQMSGFVRKLLVRRTGIPEYLGLTEDQTADLLTVVDVTTDETDDNESWCSASLEVKLDRLTEADAKAKPEIEKRAAGNLDVLMGGGIVMAWLGTAYGVSPVGKMPFEYRVWLTDEDKTMVQVTEKPKGM